VPCVVAWADGRRAEQVAPPGLRALPGDEVGGVEQHVVGVEAGEAAGARPARERRVGEEPHLRRARVDRDPVLVGDRGRVVDVDVAEAEPAQVDEVVGHAGRRAPAVGLDVRGDAQLLPAGSRLDELQPPVLGRAAPPPRDDDRVDARLGDLPHLRGDDGRVV
jgi:hypothetical protein